MKPQKNISIYRIYFSGFFENVYLNQLFIMKYIVISSNYFICFGNVFRICHVTALSEQRLIHNLLKLIYYVKDIIVIMERLYQFPLS